VEWIRFLWLRQRSEWSDIVTGDSTVSLPVDEKPASITSRLRCAIYTRKSTEEGLTQDFNTLVAQREAAEAYIRSQLHAGWITLAERYDDGGYTGANLDRPALRRLLADIAASKIDCVLIYKLDRLSRSLLDFARMMETFERHQVSLVSITQPLNTTGSLGRLTLNILLSFAEFERTLIQDRTKHMMAAARRKGKWVGGTPVLGYDIAAGGGKLVVNPEEARRVQEIFTLFLEHRSLNAMLAEMDERQWTTKRWSPRDGAERPGHQFTKASLERLLGNVVYLGKVSHQGQVYPGEHEAIVEQPVWDRAQVQLAKDRKESGVAASAGDAKGRRSGAAVPRTERVPRITRLLALALRFEKMIQSGMVSNYAELARLGQVSRSRVTQMTSLLNLAPDIQEEILFLRCGEAKQFGISEPALRKLTATLLWNQQREQSRQLRRSVQAVRIDVEASILRSKPTLQDVTDGQNTRPSRS
jgi:DNA invertase Pin-like site-specific DNA recombinase